MAILEKLFSATAIGGAFHTTARLATAAALPANTRAGAGVGATLTGNANGALSIDGTLTVAADIVLVKDEGTANKNGLYTVTTVGDGSNPFVLTRRTNFDQAASGEIEKGARIKVTAGATNISTSWILTTSGAITVDTTALTFAAGNGIATDSVNSRASREKSGIDMTILDHDRVGAIIKATEVKAPLTGTVTVQVANGSYTDMLADGLDWRPCPGVSLAGTPYPTAALPVSGTTMIELNLNRVNFSWLRLLWSGTLGEGTLDCNYVGKRSVGVP